MTDALFEVRFAGPLVSVQDSGRTGMMRYGVPASGPMDRVAFASANAALGNDPNAAGLEVSLGGLVLHCVAGAVTLAIMGGGFILDVGTQKLGSWAVVTIRAGETLTLRRGPWGSWAYVAFAGGLEAQHWLGSAATHAASGLGGGMLARGQTLRVTGPRVLPNQVGARACPIWARPRQTLRCVLGPQDRYFSAETLTDFATRDFRMTDAYDRMGVRLDGPTIRPTAALGIASEPILRGSVQVSGDGVATVLLADHQTTGGYPKIATVLDCDLDAFAQCRPKDRIRFAPLTAAQAVQTAQLAARQRATYLDQLAQTAARP